MNWCIVLVLLLRFSVFEYLFIYKTTFSFEKQKFGKKHFIRNTTLDSLWKLNIQKKKYIKNEHNIYPRVKHI